jgi:hypothetical protein
MRVRARDDLADMFVRRVGAIHKRASDELDVIQRKQREQVEDLVGMLDGVVDILADESDETAIAKAVRKLLAPKGDLEPLRESCAALFAPTRALSFAFRARRISKWGQSEPGSDRYTRVLVKSGPMFWRSQGGTNGGEYEDGKE